MESMQIKCDLLWKSSFTHFTKTERHKAFDCINRTKYTCINKFMGYEQCLAAVSQKSTMFESKFVGALQHLENTLLEHVE